MHLKNLHIGGVKKEGRKSLETGIIFFIFSIVFFVLHFIGAKLNKKTPEKVTSVGIIEQVIHTGSGNVRYYVKYQHNGIDIVGKSLHYSAKTKRKKVGEIVNIEYYFTPKGKAKVIIKDDSITACKDLVNSENHMCVKVGMFFLAFAIFSFLKSFTN